MAVKNVGKIPMGSVPNRGGVGHNRHFLNNISPYLRNGARYYYYYYKICIAHIFKHAPRVVVTISVVTVAGICDLVGGGLFLMSHRSAGAGGEYWSVSRLGLLIGNKWMSRLWDQIVPAVLECANCSLHAKVEGALSETVTTVSLSTVPRLSLLSRLWVGKWTRTRAGGRAVSLTGLTNWLAMHLCTIKWHGIYMTVRFCRSEGQFSGNSAHKDCREHCKTPLWQCWFGGSQAQRWRWKFGGRNITSYYGMLTGTCTHSIQWHCFQWPWVTPNYPKPPHFLHLVPLFISSYCVEVKTSNLVGRLIVASPSPLMTNHPCHPSFRNLLCLNVRYLDNNVLL